MKYNQGSVPETVIRSMPNKMKSLHLLAGDSKNEGRGGTGP